MKHIRKAIRIACQNLFLYCLLILFFNNIGNILTYIMLDDVDSWDWLYYYVYEGDLAFTISLALFSVLLYLYVHWVQKNIDSDSPFLPQLRAYLVMLFIMEEVFVLFFDFFCISGNPNPFNMYQGVFENGILGRLLLTTILYGLFSAEIVRSQLPNLLQDKCQSCAVQEALCNVDALEKSLYFGYPLFYLLLWQNSLWELPVMEVYSLLWCFLVGHQLYYARKTYRKLIRYFAEISEPDADSVLVVVREAPGYEMSVTYGAFLEDDLVAQHLADAGVRVIPARLYEGVPKEHVQLDIYRLHMFKLKPEEQQNIWAQAFPPSAMVCAAYCAGGDLLQKVRHYDKRISSYSNIPDEILYLTQYCRYRTDVLQILGQLHLKRISKPNPIADELCAFRNYMAKNLDSFTSFDYAIKWLEIISYFFSLVSLSNREIPVGPGILRRIINADFGKWQSMRRQHFPDTRVSAITNATVPQEDRESFDAFCWLWKVVTSQEYVFQTHTINNFFDRIRNLRNYTRGHGVFTFEITPEINLKLTVILVFLINRLIDNGLLDQSFQNLEQMGWIIYAGKTPYFLYSYDPKNRECRFDSFRTGSSLTLPEDYR